MLNIPLYCQEKRAHYELALIPEVLERNEISGADQCVQDKCNQIMSLPAYFHGEVSQKRHKQSTFIEITLWHGCSPVNLLHIFRKTFYKNSSGWLLLNWADGDPFESDKKSDLHSTATIPTAQQHIDDKLFPIMRELFRDTLCHSFRKRGSFF